MGSPMKNSEKLGNFFARNVIIHLSKKAKSRTFTLNAKPQIALFPSALLFFHTCRSSRKMSYSLVFSVLREGRFPSCFFIWLWQNGFRNVCTTSVANASRQKAHGGLCSAGHAITAACEKANRPRKLWRGFLTEFWITEKEPAKEKTNYSGLRRQWIQLKGRQLSILI